jgi:hypothetical protein
MPALSTPAAPTGTPSADACTPLNPPLPGQHWPEQGGFYAGIMRSADGLSGWHLVLPDGPAFAFKSKWGVDGKLIPGADCRFDGHANTLAMAAAGNAMAKKIRKLPGDCHLPSRAESALLYAVMPERFEPGWHWTSTQYSDYDAWYQRFNYGLQNLNVKSYGGRCRAVRRLPLQSFNSLAGAA